MNRIFGTDCGRVLTVNDCCITPDRYLLKIRQELSAEYRACMQHIFKMKFPLGDVGHCSVSEVIECLWFVTTADITVQCFRPSIHLFVGRLQQRTRKAVIGRETDLYSAAV